MTKKYANVIEVVFVVEGYIENPDGDIGQVECNGLKNNDDKWWLKDGRICYYINEATNVSEAYNQAKRMTFEDDFKDLHVTNMCLEHVYDGQKYWYTEDFMKPKAEKCSAECDVVKNLAEYIHKNIHSCPFPDDITDFDRECVGFNSDKCVNCIVKNATKLNL